MIRYLVKNYIKMMLRSKWVLLIMTLGPIIVISLLGSAFGEMMKAYEGVDEFSVGYRVEKNSVTEGNMSSIKDAGKLAGIEFVEYPDGDIADVVTEYGLIGFVSFTDKEYTIYQTDEHKAEGIVLDYFVGKVIGEMYNRMLTEDISEEISGNALHFEIEELDYIPSVTAKNYYGIVFIVYYAWCGVLTISSILSSENKNRIDKRFGVSSISRIKVYFAKLISASIANFLIISIDMIVCALWFDVKWGSLPVTVLTILLSILAANALGLFLYYVFKNLAVTVIILFVVVWFWGLFGGAFETYMFAGWSEALKRSSPIYMSNRILVDYSLMNKSDYLLEGWLYLGIIFLVCCVAALFVDKLRKKVTA